MVIKPLVLYSLLIINFWRILIVFKCLKKGCKEGGGIVIRIDSHPSIPTALSPGHKATYQIDKCARFGCFGPNVAISSLCNVHLYGFV